MRSGKAVKFMYSFEAHDNGKVLLLVPSALVAWVQCTLSSARSNVCQTQRAHAVRNQRCLGASPETSLLMSAVCVQSRLLSGVRAGLRRA